MNDRIILLLFYFCRVQLRIQSTYVLKSISRNNKIFNQLHSHNKRGS